MGYIVDILVPMYVLSSVAAMVLFVVQAHSLPFSLALVEGAELFLIIFGLSLLGGTILYVLARSTSRPRAGPTDSGD